MKTTALHWTVRLQPPRPVGEYRNVTTGQGKIRRRESLLLSWLLRLPVDAPGVPSSDFNAQVLTAGILAVLTNVHMRSN